MSNSKEQPLRRSLGRRHMARALWHIAPGRSQTQIETLLPVRDGLARVETLYSGISRGTERLVVNGLVPESEWQTMRAPMQEGTFPFPVKYGYSAAGRVVEGPEELMGRQVFCLHPHQDCFVAPVSALTVVPDAVPARRATLAGNMETALNAIWDSGVGPGDRIAVIGAGVVGLLVGRLASRLPAADVTIVDTNRERRQLVEGLGATYALPDQIPKDCDCVFHTSASGTGLETAISAAGTEATVVELSWYGTSAVEVGLGGRFHSRRLRIIGSQVGQVSQSRRGRWDYARRLGKALELLDDPALDGLVENEVPFDDVAGELPRILAGDYMDLPPVIRYAKPDDAD